MYLELPVVKCVSIAKKGNFPKRVLFHAGIVQLVNIHLVQVVPPANLAAQGATELDVNYVQLVIIDRPIIWI